ncbi:cupin-like domain-containing protein [Erythrobacter sp. EC-HK427]|uniref:cupin-like domain-containing protein n=1 Tax=Erythrobacter sp. EC-HK427 TaxID=2038396 RepID=UPI001259BB90|nr:cupin-like domain-containing protein [Erythrobacter sp. EC-HK427]VVT20063.1 Transcriptional regulator [Erythrobacter sp. EC-HK427]
MSRIRRSLHGRAIGGKRAFSERARSFFKSSYPEGAHRLEHEMVSNPLLELDALALLGSALPASSVEYNRGDLPLGVTGKPEGNGLTIEQTIRGIHDNNSWAVLKNIEQKKPYAALLEELLDELRPVIEERTGKMLKLQAFIFISSPGAVTPYHFDPEHNILLQLTGKKTMTVFPAGDPMFAPDAAHEAYHTGGPRELRWRDEFLPHGVNFNLRPGDAVYVPVMAPHFVRNGKDVSISLSITWRSEWSFNEADARAFNHLLRRFGVSPAAPGRWPSSNSFKANAMRVARRIPGLT